MICAHNHARVFDFIPCIWSRPHDKDCLYILSSSKNSFSHISTYGDVSLSLSISLTHTHTFWLPEIVLSLFISTSRNSLTLPVSKTQLNTRNMGAYTFCDPFLSCSAFSVRLVPASNSASEISSNPEEINDQYGRRHVPPRIHCYISVYWYLAWNT